MLKAVIIDDEASAMRAFGRLMEVHADQIQLVGNACSATTGIALIDTVKPDVVFLDIHMPGMDGFDLLARVQHKDFDIIFTTAHSHYALQAIKQHPVDYLLKPIDPDELESAIDVIIRKRGVGVHDEASNAYKRLGYEDSLILPDRTTMNFLRIADIIWVRSEGSYCTFFMVDGLKQLVSKNIGEFEVLLPEEFFRPHKSYLINLKRVKSYIRSDGHYVEMEDGSMVEVSRRKRVKFSERVAHILKGTISRESRAGTEDAGL